MENREKWIMFFWGASPTLLVLIISLVNSERAIAAFLGTSFYLLIGSVVAIVVTGEKHLSPLITGIFSGIFASGILTATMCF